MNLKASELTEMTSDSNPGPGPGLHADANIRVRRGGRANLNFETSRAAAGAAAGAAARVLSTRSAQHYGALVRIFPDDNGRYVFIFRAQGRFPISSFDTVVYHYPFANGSCADGSFCHAGSDLHEGRIRLGESQVSPPQ
jgi:hypothetical protein